MLDSEAQVAKERQRRAQMTFSDTHLNIHQILVTFLHHSMALLGPLRKEQWLKGTASPCKGFMDIALKG